MNSHIIEMNLTNAVGFDYKVLVDAISTVKGLSIGGVGNVIAWMLQNHDRDNFFSHAPKHATLQQQIVFQMGRRLKSSGRKLDFIELPVTPEVMALAGVIRSVHKTIVMRLQSERNHDCFKTLKRIESSSFAKPEQYRLTFYYV